MGLFCGLLYGFFLGCVAGVFMRDVLDRLLVKKYDRDPRQLSGDGCTVNLKAPTRPRPHPKGQGGVNPDPPTIEKPWPKGMKHQNQNSTEPQGPAPEPKQPSSAWLSTPHKGGTKPKPSDPAPSTHPKGQ